jgi:hypothetical protein
VAENQPDQRNKNRMTSELANFAARLRGFISASPRSCASRSAGRTRCCEGHFNALALELFSLQFVHNIAYRRICESRGVTPQAVNHWKQIPAVPTGSFKELTMTCLPPAQWTNVFHSSGTTDSRPSRHFHSAESLALYEASLWPWFRAHLLPDWQSAICNLQSAMLTPPPAAVPHSSLVHMFEVVQREQGSDHYAFVGRVADDGAWTLDFDATLEVLRGACDSETPLMLLGTAFSFVHLLDRLAEQNLWFRLPPGSRVMETGGYKGRSRNLPKVELHTLIMQRLGVPPSHILCEYGMSELSSQAYDRVTGVGCRVTRNKNVARHPSPATRHFHFPLWARAQITSPETGLEVGESQTGLIRVFDLANVWSVMAVQTEDLGIRRGDGFELLGRTALAEPRGCSLMAVNA